MAKMPKRKPDSCTYFRINGVGAACQLPNGNWQVDARRKGIPSKLQRPVFSKKSEARAHLLKLKEILKNFGQYKATNHDFFSDDDLTQSRIILSDFNKKHGTDFKIPELVELGAKAASSRIESEKYPIFATVIESYLEHRAKPQGKKHGGGTIEKNQLRQEKQFLKEVRSWAGNQRLDHIFSPEYRLRKRAQDFMWNILKKLDGNQYGQLTLKKNAKIFTALLHYAKEEFPQLIYPNPLLGWHSQFDKQYERIPKMLRVEDVERLFDTALTQERWTKLIPAMTLVFFSGARPSEIATEEKHRRFQWENFNEWKIKSRISGGILYKLPPFRIVDGSKKRMAKKSTVQWRDLVPIGVQWLKWYYTIHMETSFPTSGQIFHSRRYWDGLRKECGLYGEDWEKDASRHTFASFAHAHWPSQREYWITHCGHRGGTLERHYQSPEATPDKAEYYFSRIVPPNIKEAEAAHKQKIRDWQKWMKREHGVVNADPCESYEIEGRRYYYFDEAEAMASDKWSYK